MLTDTFPWYYDKYDLEKKEINSFIQQECIKLIKSDSKNNNVTKKTISNKCCSVNLVSITKTILQKRHGLKSKINNIGSHDSK